MDGNDRRIAAFTSLGHATFHTYELSIPVFVAIWLDAFSASPALIGTVVAVGYALVGLGAPVSGILADAFGSRRLVLVSLAGMGGGFVVLSVAPSVATIGLALVVWGAAASLYHPAGLSLISRGARRRGPTLAYHGAAGNVGMAAGPLLAVVLLSFFDWRVVAGALVVPAAIAVVSGVGLRFEEDAAVADGGERRDGDGRTDVSGPDGARSGDAPTLHPRTVLGDTRALFTGGFLIVFAVYVLYGTYYRGVFTFLPDVLSGLPIFPPAELFGRTVEPGQYVYSGLLTIGVVGQYVGGRISETVDLERAIVGVYAVVVVASLAFVPAASVGVPALLAVCAVIGFFVYVFVPLGQELIAEYAPADLHGLTYGYTYLGLFGVGAVGASLAGFVLAYASTSALFVVLAGLAAVCGLLSAWLVVRA